MEAFDDKGDLTVNGPGSGLARLEVVEGPLDRDPANEFLSPSRRQRRILADAHSDFPWKAKVFAASSAETEWATS